MWFYYLVGAIGISIGTSALLGIEVDQKTASTARIEAPDTHAASAATISRALRSKYSMEPGLFPSPRGNAIQKIPDSVVSSVLRGGMSLPPDVAFTIDAFGRISSQLDQNSKTNLDRYISALDKMIVPVGETAMNLVDRVISSESQINDFQFDGSIAEGISVGTVATRIGLGMDINPANNPILNSGGTIQNPYDDGGAGYGPINPDQLDPAAIIPERDPDTVMVIPPDDENVAPLGEESPSQYTNSNDIRFDIERQFDAYCAALNAYSETELEAFFDKYKTERTASITAEINNQYSADIKAFPDFADNEYADMIDAKEKAEKYQSWIWADYYKDKYEEAQEKVDLLYNDNPHWKNLNGDKTNMKTYFGNIKTTAIRKIPSTNTADINAIAAASEAAIEYCGAIYTMREEMHPEQIQANSANNEERQALAQGTQKIMDRNLGNDKDFISPKTANMKKISKVALAAIGVRKILTEYPIDAQVFTD